MVNIRDWVFYSIGFVIGGLYEWAQYNQFHFLFLGMILVICAKALFGDYGKQEE